MRKLTVKEMLAVSGGDVQCWNGQWASNYSNCPVRVGTSPQPPVDACLAAGGRRIIYGYCSIPGIR